MKNFSPNLIVMLTHHDFTVGNPEEIFDSARSSKASFWGMKEVPIPLPRMKNLYDEMRREGKKTVLEVVGYDEASGLEGAAKAAECGVDILMGTKFFPSIARICRDNGIKYMPFVGTITGRPSLLSGSKEEMLAEAAMLAENGVFGIDILGYRYVGDAPALIESFVDSVALPVCVAGSIDSLQRLDEVKQFAPWAFTIGSAFFEGKFGDSFAAQIDRVVDHIAR